MVSCGEDHDLGVFCSGLDGFLEWSRYIHHVAMADHVELLSLSV